MTHPLTDDICQKLSSWHFDVLDPGLAEKERNDLRKAADWQLEQVKKWLKTQTDYSHQYLALASEYQPVQGNQIHYVRYWLYAVLVTKLR